MAILTLDDRDPSIVYSGGWDHGGSSFEFNRTTTWTDVAGSTAKFTFQGTSIGVYGTISIKKSKSIAPVSSYSIDGGAPVEFKAVQEDKIQYSQLFFQSPLLPSGTHTLSITNDLASDPLFLDFLMVLTATGPRISSLPITSASSTSSSTSSSASSATSASSSSSSPYSSSTIPTHSSSYSVSTTPSFGATSRSTPSTQSSTTPFSVSGDDASSASAASAASGAGVTKNSHSGAIAGGIIAASLAVTLVVFSVLSWLRKRGRRKSLANLASAKSKRPWAPISDPISNTALPVRPSVLGKASPPRSTQPNMTQAEDMTHNFSRPRYPVGYVSGTDYNSSSANLPPATSTFAVESSSEISYYGQELLYPQNKTQGRSYIPPSQFVDNSTNHYTG